MSEYINNIEKRRESIFNLSLAIFGGVGSKHLIDKYREVLENITPHDVIDIVDRMVKMDIPVDRIKSEISKVINVISRYLKEYVWKLPEESDFLNSMLQENKAVLTVIQKIKDVLKKKENASSPEKISDDDKSELLGLIRQLREIEKHYQKKENIFFPYLEKNWSDYRCVSVMWAIHDDIRESLNILENLLTAGSAQRKEIVSEIGTLFFAVYAIIFREENILFPVAAETLPEEDWYEMYKQSFEIGFTLIDPPAAPRQKKAKKENRDYSAEVVKTNGKLLDLDTGYLALDQILMLLNTLPVDITFVDENDEVRFFSNPKDRFFTRSKAIIGRKVQNCHPPESIEIVNQIVESFRSGKKEKESFWIQMRGKFILIQYFAIRDDSGNYKGTLEVSQDITEIRELKGEKRLIS